MMAAHKNLSAEQLRALHSGLVIPAHPLALNSSRQLDERRRRTLTRYYMASGAGGIAVAVHSTQFEIREERYNLLEPVLRLAAEEVDNARLTRPFLKIAGICGFTDQALAEAELAAKLGYDAGLLSMGGLQGWSEEEILCRTEAVAEVMPVIGFYLQPSVGGAYSALIFGGALPKFRELSRSKWLLSTGIRRLMSCAPYVIQAAAMKSRCTREMTTTSSMIC